MVVVAGDHFTHGYFSRRHPHAWSRPPTHSNSRSCATSVAARFYRVNASFRWPCRAIMHYIRALSAKASSPKKTRLRSKLGTDDRIKDDRSGCCNFVQDAPLSRNISRRIQPSQNDSSWWSHFNISPRLGGRPFDSLFVHLCLSSLYLRFSCLTSFQTSRGMLGGPIRPQDREPRSGQPVTVVTRYRN